MTTPPLRIGIVGGNAERAWARDAHVPALARLTDTFTLDAVSARTQPLADAAAAAFKAPRAFGDSLALVRDPAIDIVAVTVKVPEHRAIVLAALEAGKHVYCEWPLGRDVAESAEMAEAARRARERAGSHVMIGTQALSAPAIRHAVRLVQDGVIGEPRVLRVFSPTAGWGPVAPPFLAYLQDKRNGATMAAIAGGHTLAAIDAMVGPFREVDARNSIFLKKVRITGSNEMVERTCADHMLVTGLHANGCVSTLEVAGGVTDQHVRFELAGSKGRLTITGTHGGSYQVSGDLRVECSVPAEPCPPPAIAALAGPPSSVGEAWVRFGADIRNGTRSVPDFDLALRLARVLDAIDTASDTGRRQTLA